MKEQDVSVCQEDVVAALNNSRIIVRKYMGLLLFPSFRMKSKISQTIEAEYDRGWYQRCEELEQALNALLDHFGVDSNGKRS